MTTRAKKPAGKAALLPSYKLMMPNPDGSMMVAMHVVKGERLVYDAVAVRRFRMMEYCACVGIPYDPSIFASPVSADSSEARA